MEEELNSLMRKYTEILKEQNKIKKEKEDVKSEILILIKMNDITRHQSPDNIILTHKSFKSRRLDKSKLVEYCNSHEIDYTKFEKEIITERLMIKEIEEDNKEED